ncbi:polyphenol oxidase family protein [bacterium]|nr:polyphenol oxidase family protein [bacterium]
MSSFSIGSAGPFPLGRFDGLAALPGLAHGVSTREGPDLRAATDSPDHALAARQLAAALGLTGAAWLRQVHGARVTRARVAGFLGEGDALISAQPGLALIVRSADCPLVLAAALDGRGRPTAVGVAHASWRSTVAGIAPRMLLALALLAGHSPGRLRVALAPSAGPCCYEVGPEVREAAVAEHGRAAGAWFPERGGRLIFDLWRANAEQLALAGLPPGRLELAGVCTICEDAHFHSWRRDGAAAGRFAAVIGLRA